MGGLVVSEFVGGHRARERRGRGDVPERDGKQAETRGVVGSGNVSGIRLPVSDPKLALAIGRATKARWHIPGFPPAKTCECRRAREITDAAVEGAKRARKEDPPMPSSFPLAAPLHAHRLLIVGGVYVDVLLEVEEYPEEDSACRMLSCTRKRGGNAGTNAVVLAQLVGTQGLVSWVGVSPGADDVDGAFAVGELEGAGVHTAWREEVAGAGQPTSYITLSRKTGTRTIVSTRNGMRELSPAHFATTLETAAAATRPLGWIHLECREIPSVAQMAAAARAGAAARGAVLSVEVEKPYLALAELAPLLCACDLVILSRESLERQMLGHAAEAEVEEEVEAEAAAPSPETHAAVVGLRELRRRVAELADADSASMRGALWVCPWGKAGAYAVDGGGHSHGGGAALHAPAVGVGVADGGAIDTVRAGNA